jgi:hypothetical protein
LRYTSDLSAMQDDRAFAERPARVRRALDGLEQCAPELPPYFAALEHPGFRHWVRMLAAADALLDVYGRAKASGPNGRLSEQAFAWRVWRIANVYHGATVRDNMRLEGGISRRTVQLARAAWERPSPKQHRLYRELGLLELERQAFRPLSQQTIKDIFGPRLSAPRAKNARHDQ